MQIKWLFLLMAALFLTKAYAQDHAFDLTLVSNKKLIADNEFSHYKRAGNSSNIMQSHRHSWLATYNPFSLTLRSTMYLYQNVLSAQLSKSCPYQVTCSNFSKQAINRFGVVKGMFLSADRLMRCNRIAILDVNPLDIDEKTGTIIDPLSRY